MVEISKQSTSWKTIMEQMTGNVVISEAHTLMYVVLSKARKHVPYGELVGTTECTTVQLRCRTNHGRYNRVQLYLLQYIWWY
jgi:hypothetical protein